MPKGAPLLAVYGGPVDHQRALGAIEIDHERSMRLDAAFGLRQLMDIAARALSPGVNDPATAVQVMDELHDLLRRMAQRQLSDGSCYDGEGRIRVILRIVDWGEILALTLDEMRRLGSGSMAVTRRLRSLLEDLLTIVPPFRRAALEQQMTLLDQSVESGFETEFERRLAREGDPRGSGF